MHLSSHAIVDLHDQMTRAWHEAPEASLQPSDPWLAAVARQHRANFDLWHIEDEARNPGATDAQLAAVKRRIDATNQRRNDLAEELDRTLMTWLESQGLPNAEAPLHSESPGLIIDRLSILALKIYHTREEAERSSAPAGHTSRCRDRLAILEGQRTDLAGCLQNLFQETLAGTRRFKLYRQLKMYNDPSLNPAIYRKLPGEPGQ
jgi:erythromycin esterase-like protein